MGSWVDRYIRSRPTEQHPEVQRVVVEGATCPICSGHNVRRYPVACHQGARMATKCQDCLHTLSLQRPTAGDLWPAFRSVTYDWEASPAERATRDALEREERD